MSSGANSAPLLKERGMPGRLTRPGRVGDGRWTKRELEASLYNWLELAKRECTGTASKLIEAKNIDTPVKQPHPRKR